MDEPSLLTVLLDHGMTLGVVALFVGNFRPGFRV